MELVSLDSRDDDATRPLCERMTLNPEQAGFFFSFLPEVEAAETYSTPRSSSS